MASIQKRPNDKYRARYRDAAGKEHARHFTRKLDAQRWLDEVTTSRLTGTYVDPGRSRITVDAMSGAWLQNPKWSETTKARNRSILDKHVLPRWGTTKLVDVQHEDVQAWVNELSSTSLAGGTVRKISGVLSGILALAVRSKRLAVNPARDVDLPEQDLGDRNYLTAAEVEALADASDEYGDLVLVLAYCGLRIGEAAALRVRHVDMLRRRLQVEESVTEVNGKLIWSATKDKERRSVPFPAFLTEDIAGRCEGKGKNDLLFTTGRGGTIRVRNMRRDWFDLAAKIAEVEVTPHELRHTAASLAVRAGASVLVVQRMLGHKKPSMTLDVYADLFDDDLDTVADRLTTVRAEALADSVRTTAVSNI
ncbi:site-specific integrase [Georgenia sp. MJ173]|uniref:tyrosine-type recombinase/integrase n=1 Tax=Georgenia sunbinii TaxID=3117728 RepID=UPI002F265DA8